MFQKSTLALLIILFIAMAQPCDAQLTVEKIMRNPRWIGSSPINPQWSQDGKYLYFRWNPDKALADSIYYISLANKTPVKANRGIDSRSVVLVICFVLPVLRVVMKMSPCFEYT